jgi:hypothetical protein
MMISLLLPFVYFYQVCPGGGDAVTAGGAAGGGEEESYEPHQVRVILTVILRAYL